MVKQIDLEALLDDALVKMMLDYPIYTNILVKIGIELVEESKHDAIAWTDGNGVYINKRYVENLNANPMRPNDEGKIVDCTITKDELIFILCHELLHLIGLTWERGANRGIVPDEDKQDQWHKWNMATDYEINGLLVNGEIGTMPGFGLYDKKYDKLCAEEIYDLLPDDNSGKSGQGNGDDNNDSSTDPNVTPNLDKHIPITDEVVRNKVITAISETYRASKQNGLGDKSIERMLERAFKPVPFNWRRALNKYMKRFRQYNYTWNRPSRAGIANNLILPSQGKEPVLRIGVAIDTSGSIGNKELHTMMEYLFNILQQFKAFEIDVWCCGSRVYEESLKTFTNSNKQELYTYQIISDGGNDMRHNFPFVEKHYKQDKIDCLIVFSDLYDPINGDTETKSTCPVIFMVLDHKDAEAPTGMQCELYHVEAEEKQ